MYTSGKPKIKLGASQQRRKPTRAISRIHRLAELMQGTNNKNQGKIRGTSVRLAEKKKIGLHSTASLYGELRVDRVSRHRNVFLDSAWNGFLDQRLGAIQYAVKQTKPEAMSPLHDERILSRIYDRTE